MGGGHAVCVLPSCCRWSRPSTWLVPPMVGPLLARAVVRPLMLCPARVGEEESMAARI